MNEYAYIYVIVVGGGDLIDADAVTYRYRLLESQGVADAYSSYFVLYNISTYVVLR